MSETTRAASIKPHVDRVEIGRRTFLRVAGAGAAGSAGLAGILGPAGRPRGPRGRSSTSCTGWTSCRPATRS
jgi:hypothetical protein